MPSEKYSDAVASFSWAAVHKALDWKPEQKISLGHSIVDRHVQSERVALIAVARDGSDQRFTFRDLSDKSNRFANLLRRLGVQPGDRVAGLMPRGVDVVVAIIGTLKAGAIYVPVFTGFGPDAIRFRLDHCSANVLVTHSSVMDQLPDGLKATTICVAEAHRALPESWIDFHREVEKESAGFPCCRAIEAMSRR